MVSLCFNFIFLIGRVEYLFVCLLDSYVSSLLKTLRIELPFIEVEQTLGGADFGGRSGVCSWTCLQHPIGFWMWKSATQRIGEGWRCQFGGC